MVQVYLEIGSVRTFTTVAQWPGWCRSGQIPREQHN